MVLQAPIPHNENARLAALRSYGILDTAPDERFDLFTRLGTWIFGVPVSAINLVDSDRTFFKSAIGFDAFEPRRYTSICAHAVWLDQPIMQVEDLSRDSRFHDDPLVVNQGLRFYAGALLRSDTGHAMGTLCIGGAEPRVLSVEESLKLTELARGVGAVLELHRYGVRMLEAATKDELTGLFNRRHFAEVVQTAIARAAAGTPCALMYLDVDRFKHVNDTLGHGAGDALLRELGQRLTANARGNDIVARLAGDEFVLLMCDGAGALQAELLAARLLAAFETPFTLAGQSVLVRASIGIALCPDHAQAAADLMHCADLALYDAKKNGGGCFRIYNKQAAALGECAA